MLAVVVISWPCHQLLPPYRLLTVAFGIFSADHIHKGFYGDFGALRLAGFSPSEVRDLATGGSALRYVCNTHKTTTPLNCSGPSLPSLPHPLTLVVPLSLPSLPHPSTVVVPPSLPFLPHPSTVVVPPSLLSLPHPSTVVVPPSLLSLPHPSTVVVPPFPLYHTPQL